MFLINRFKDKLRDLTSLKRRLRRHQNRYIHRIIRHAGIDVVIDVGANYGQTYFTLRENKFRGKVISFEPIPAAHEALEHYARVDPDWTVAPRCVVGSDSGDVLVNVSEASYMSSVLDLTPAMLAAHPRLRNTEKVQTPSVSLDDVYDTYCGENDEVFLKIDTQGYEREVVKGATRTLERIRGLQIELSLLPLYLGEETYLSFLNEFHAAGFEPHMMIENGFAKAWNRQRQIDVIFMRSPL